MAAETLGQDWFKSHIISIYFAAVVNQVLKPGLAPSFDS